LEKGQATWVDPAESWQGGEPLRSIWAGGGEDIEISLRGWEKKGNECLILVAREQHQLLGTRLDEVKKDGALK